MKRICITILLLISPILTEPITAMSLDSMYVTGIHDVQTGDLTAAHGIFEHLVEQQRPALGYIGLAMIESAKGKQLRALQYLDRAQRLEPNNPEVYYRRAQVHLQNYRGLPEEARLHAQRATRLDPANPAYWQLLMRIERLYEQPSDGYYQALRGAVLAAPTDIALVDRFITEVRVQHRENDAIPVFEELLRSTQHPSLVSALADGFLATAQFTRALQTIDAYLLSGKTPKSTALFRHRAVALFELERDREGENAYWTAVRQATSPKDAELLFRDMSFIMNSAEYETYPQHAPSALMPFYKDFWMSRDPDLSTNVNERLAEHYRRLGHAQRNYRRLLSTSQWLEKHQTVTTDETQAGLEQTASLLMHDLAPALLNDRRIDDAGVIYIRHGQPDIQTTAFGAGTLEDLGLQMQPKIQTHSSLPQNMSWKYNTTRYRPTLVFHFSKLGGMSGWIATWFPATLENRSELGGRYARLEQMSQRSEYEQYVNQFKPRTQEEVLIDRGQQAMDFQMEIQEIQTETQQQLEIAMTTESSDVQFPEQPFFFPYKLLTFKSEQGNTLVEIYYGIDGKETALDSTGHLNIDKFMGFWSAEWQELAAVQKSYQLPFRMSASQWQQFATVFVDRFVLPPGLVHFQIQLIDETAKRRSMFKGQQVLPDYTRNFAMSDIIISGPLHMQPTDTPFRKGEIVYDPHMFYTFERGSTLGMYFELYNLETDASGGVDYEISFTFQAVQSTSKNRGFLRSLFSGDTGSITITNRYSGTTTDEQVFINHQLEKTIKGRYEMIVMATDLNAGKSTKNRVELVVD